MGQIKNIKLHIVTDIKNSTSTCKPVSAVTKLVPNSGKSSLTSMVSTQLEPTMGIQTYNWSVSTSTTMKPLAENMFPAPYLWIWNQAPWTRLDLDHSDKSLDLITLFSD